MVKDKTNQVYTELIQYLKSLYPKLNGGTEYPSSEPKLPYLYFFQLDAPTKLDDLSNNEVGVKPIYQVEVYTDTGMNSARKIANDARTFMIENGFRCKNFMPIQVPSNVSRFVGRYERLEV
jgi:hypothetical protein